MWTKRRDVFYTAVLKDERELVAMGGVDSDSLEERVSGQRGGGGSPSASSRCLSSQEGRRRGGEGGGLRCPNKHREKREGDKRRFGERGRIGRVNKGWRTRARVAKEGGKEGGKSVARSGGGGLIVGPYEERGRRVTR